MSVQTDVPKYLTVRGAVKTMNPEFVALWEPYLDEGYSYKAVGEIFGVYEVTVKKHFPGRGWTVEEKLAHGLEVRRFNAQMRKVHAR